MKPNKLMRKAIQAGKQYRKSVQLQKCIACNGTGYYDIGGRCKCSACNGMGFEK